MLFQNYFGLEPVAPSTNLPAVLQSLRNSNPLSLSRDANRLQWGIRVPDDESQTVCLYTHKMH